jgi:hypothetical protein
MMKPEHKSQQEPEPPINEPDPDYLDWLEELL